MFPYFSNIFDIILQLTFARFLILTFFMSFLETVKYFSNRYINKFYVPFEVILNKVFNINTILNNNIFKAKFSITIHISLLNSMFFLFLRKYSGEKSWTNKQKTHEHSIICIKIKSSVHKIENYNFVKYYMILSKFKCVYI